MKYKEETIKKVTEAIIGLLENDILQENNIEGFEGWCEDGDIFDDDEEAIALMKEVAPFVDDLTYKGLCKDGQFWGVNID
jgi:hypothetical protein